METLVVRIPKDGKTAKGLYSDAFPWENLGELDIKRASDVRFSQEHQKWEVWVRNEGQTATRLPERFAKRADAIAYEVLMLQGAR